ncbi:unnamed protein product [Gadus morhua 'NCC']
MISHDHFELAVRLTYPSDFSTSYLYGLLLMVESPPGGQGVSDEFRLGFDWLLASSEQVVVARVDGRGSGFRGQRFLHQIHQKLGTVDVQDQLAALEYLGKLPYIDQRRVGIYGQIAPSSAIPYSFVTRFIPPWNQHTGPRCPGLP